MSAVAMSVLQQQLCHRPLGKAGATEAAAAAGAHSPTHLGQVDDCHHRTAGAGLVLLGQQQGIGVQAASEEHDLGRQGGGP